MVLQIPDYTRHTNGVYVRSAESNLTGILCLTRSNKPTFDQVVDLMQESAYRVASLFFYPGPQPDKNDPLSRAIGQAEPSIRYGLIRKDRALLALLESISPAHDNDLETKFLEFAYGVVYTKAFLNPNNRRYFSTAENCLALFEQPNVKQEGHGTKWSVRIGPYHQTGREVSLDETVKRNIFAHEITETPRQEMQRIIHAAITIPTEEFNGFTDNSYLYLLKAALETMREFMQNQDEDDQNTAEPWKNISSARNILS
ncbi:hypothetical protein HYV86_02790 [Candidatus Woesearchaeota archaeon]|nr:hypothetical protein [Candidatus Woesearchaeota archaeon]